MTSLVGNIYMMLYEEEAQGLDGLEKISKRWPARCHVTHHVHVAELKETAPSTPPYQHATMEADDGGAQNSVRFCASGKSHAKHSTKASLEPRGYAGYYWRRDRS